MRIKIGSRAGQGGAALIMVIWVLAALSIILSEFVFSSRTSLNAARNRKMDATSYYLALGAFSLAVDEISGDYQYLLPGDGGGVIFMHKGEQNEEGQEYPVREGTIPGAGKYFYQITDEESKMNINSVDRKQLVEFFRLLGIPMGVERDTIVDSILDWRDSNDMHRLNGAEDDYYQSLAPPYSAKNNDFDSAEELLLVKGMTREIFYGLKTGSGKSLSELVTVFGDRLNFNTASEEVIRSFYVQPGMVTKITGEREIEPYRDQRGTSSYFTIIAGGVADGSKNGRKIKALVNRSSRSGEAAEATVLQWNDNYREPAQKNDQDES